MGRTKVRKPLKKGIAKVPVIMQMEALECGASCLGMVMAYYDKWVSPEQVRADCDVSRDGSNAKCVVKAARSYGFEATGYKLSAQDLREQGTFPCILFWNNEHFVVLDGFTRNHAVINDPAEGRVKLPMKDFERFFSGICLNITPGPEFSPSGKRKSTLVFAHNKLKTAISAVVFTAVTAIISYLFGVINPIMTQIFLDMILPGKAPTWLMPFIGIMALLAGLQVLVGLINAVYSFKISGKLGVAGSTSYMWKILGLPMEFFSQRMAGDILHRKESNANIVNTLVKTLGPIVLDVFLMIFYLVIMIRKSPILTLVGVSAQVINIFLSRLISSKRLNITRVQMRDNGNLASQTVAGISMAETIKASGAEVGFFAKWAGYQAKVNTGNVRLMKINEYIGMIPTLLTKLANSLVLIMGVFLVMRNEVSLGMVVSFQGLMGFFMNPATTLIESGQTIQEMRTEMERIDDVMQYPSDPNVNFAPEDKTVSYEKLSGSVEIKNVTFGYSKMEEPLIKDFSLSIKSGQCIAIAGASGSGKSTISKLITGLNHPWSGEILFDGKKINEIDRNVFTGSITVVDQNITLFEGTIADNIRMWDPSIEDFEVILAARDAQIHDYITQLPGSYNYRLTENAKDLSGGQRQLVELARALAQDPKLLILDEATSALDAKTEYEVIKAIRNRGISVLVISHRLSIIRDCDQILVFDHGRIAEQGTHDELYKLNGLYKELIASE